MAWTVVFFSSFEAEFDELSVAVQDKILQILILLEQEGPSLGRPHVDTLIGSKHANLKEIRCQADGGVWRIAFAFDPARDAIVLVAGNKSGQNQHRFYKSLIAKADERFDQHINLQNGEKS